MKIILSRKGFDSNYGGCPSPVFPDGSILSLPIPDKKSPIRYSDLEYEGLNLGEIVADLTGHPKRATHFAHLDPDLRYDSLPRNSGWRPSLGQIDRAQAHLRNQGVTEGDIFLFFGLFRGVEFVNGKWRFDRQSSPFHAIWGWLQIDEVCLVKPELVKQYPWFENHPHFFREENSSNTLYIGRHNLDLVTQGLPIAGAGKFPSVRNDLLLTDPNSKKVTEWKLPRFFYPAAGKPPLSYHKDRRRWQLDAHHCRLQCVSRGQEFVLDSTFYPDALPWVETLLRA